MAGNPRVTMFFSLGRATWTETHWAPQANTLTDAIPSALALMKIRVKLLGKQTKLDKCRLSFDGVFRDALLIGQDNIPSNPQALAAGGAGGGPAPPAGELDSDIPNVACIIRAEAGELSRKTIFLAGNPDSLAGGQWPNQDINPNLAWWGKAFDGFAKGMVTLGFGYIGRKTGVAQTPVVGLQGDATPPTMYAIQIGNGTLGAINTGDYIQLRGFQVKSGANRVNGKYQVASNPTIVGGNQIVFLRNTVQIDPTSILKWGKAEKVASEFLPYTSLIPQYMASRRRGGRTGLPLGRRKTRK